MVDMIDMNFLVHFVDLEKRSAVTSVTFFLSQFLRTVDGLQVGIFHPFPDELGER
jgi:hypothetical protein